MAEVMSMIPDETTAGELNADEQESLQVGEELEQEQGRRLAGKYKNADELEAAYIELQKKLGEKQDEPVEEEQVVEEQDDTSILDRLWEEARSDSEVSPETIDAIAKADPSKLAEMYLEYRSQQETTTPLMSDADVKDVKAIAGGEAQYNEMIGWAGQNLSQQEIEMFDSVMALGNAAAAKFAAEALNARYQDAVGVEGNLVRGKAATDSRNTFRSQSEVIEAMSDPRYDKDPAYRSDVMRRLEKSDVPF